MRGRPSDGECISFCNSAISFQFGATKPHHVNRRRPPSSLCSHRRLYSPFPTDDRRLSIIEKINLELLIQSDTRAVIDNGLSYICQAAISEQRAAVRRGKARREAGGEEGNACEKRNANIYKRISLRDVSLSFSVYLSTYFSFFLFLFLSFSASLPLGDLATLRARKTRFDLVFTRQKSTSPRATPRIGDA